MCYKYKTATQKDSGTAIDRGVPSSSARGTAELGRTESQPCAAMLLCSTPCVKLPMPSRTRPSRDRFEQSGSNRTLHVMRLGSASPNIQRHSDLACSSDAVAISRRMLRWPKHLQQSRNTWKPSSSQIWEGEPNKNVIFGLPSQVHSGIGPRAPGTRPGSSGTCPGALGHPGPARVRGGGGGKPTGSGSKCSIRYRPLLPASLTNRGERGAPNYSAGVTHTA
jgi:hypothetical protein